MGLKLADVALIIHAAKACAVCGAKAGDFGLFGMEHAAGGTIHCFYAQNPLYTEILIWDEGKGFAKEDLPHLFERFYRGQDAKEGGIGIGLALAKEIMERQNGTIRAKNRPEGGACFEIRFYSNI